MQIKIVGKLCDICGRMQICAILCNYAIICDTVRIVKFAPSLLNEVRVSAWRKNCVISEKNLTHGGSVRVRVRVKVRGFGRDCRRSAFVWVHAQPPPQKKTRTVIVREMGRWENGWQWGTSLRPARKDPCSSMCHKLPLLWDGDPR